MTADKLLQHLPALCNQVKRLAIEAGDATIPFYDESGSGEFTDKADGSPVTEADRIAHDIIIQGLREITPSVPIVSEENEDHPDISGAEYFWLVDPLDGTRGFIQGNADYTVNIALIQNKKPVMGVIYAPILGELYSGHGPDTAMRWLEETGHDKSIRMRSPKSEGMIVVVSNYKGNTPKQDLLLEEFKVSKLIKRASSIKFCMLAAGKADFYLCLRSISEWDTAAGEAIIRAAGGYVLDMEGNELEYGKSDKNYTHPFFQATSSPELVVPVELLK